MSNTNEWRSMFINVMHSLSNIIRTWRTPFIVLMACSLFYVISNTHDTYSKLGLSLYLVYQFYELTNVIVEI